MLKSNGGEIEINGRKIDLMSEFAQLTHQLIYKGVFTDEDIAKCIDIAKKSDEDIHAAAEALRKDNSDAFDEMLAQLANLFGIK